MCERREQANCPGLYLEQPAQKKTKSGKRWLFMSLWETCPPVSQPAQQQASSGAAARGCDEEQGAAAAAALIAASA